MSYIFDKNDTTSLIKEGDYETKIEKLEVKTLPSGKEKLAITYRIRTDIEQPYGNRTVFEDIWAERENPQYFNRKRINQLLGTQDIADGTVFDGVNDIIDYLVGKCLVIHVAVVLDEYRGEDVNTVSYYKSSKNKPEIITTTRQQPSVEISESDLPF